MRWFRGVMVSTLGFEPTDPGSNPGETFLSVWRNWIAHQTSNLGVAGSSPVMDIFCQVTRVWSKGCDLRSHAKCFVGSNPTPDIIKT